MIFVPGASTSGLMIQQLVGPFPLYPGFRYCGSSFSSSLAPTVSTLREIPGTVTVCSFGPLLPAAAMTMIPISHRSSIASRSRFCSSYFALGRYPMEKLSRRIRYFSWFFFIQSRARSTRSVLPFPFASSTLSTTRFAFGAIPAYFPRLSLPLPHKIPATCVPCPLSS